MNRDDNFIYQFLGPRHTDIFAHNISILQYKDITIFDNNFLATGFY